MPNRMEHHTTESDHSGSDNAYKFSRAKQVIEAPRHEGECRRHKNGGDNGVRSEEE